MKYLKRLYGTAVIDHSDSEEIQEDCKIELEYYQVKSDTPVKAYGIEVVKRNIENNRMNIEDKSIYNIYDKEQDTNKLLKILITNKVTPVSVEDVIEDFMETKVI